MTGETEETLPAPPNPAKGWSRQLVTLQKAVCIPPANSAMIQAAGVLHNGQLHPASITWRGARQMLTAPEEPKNDDEVETLSGRHLYAGQIWVHFGHFLCESTSRLWGLTDGNSFDSIVFLPKRPSLGEHLNQMHHQFFDLLGCDAPVQVLTQPTQLAELVVPGQGFGLGEIAAATPEFRQFVRDRFATDVEPDGPERLYISRSELGPKRGGIFSETVLEQNLAAQGYEVFHPQHHSMRDQIARYKAARQIISLDGSALHLFGFVGQPDQQVAMILRRNSGVYRNIQTQLRSLCGIDPDIVNVIARDWVPEDMNRPNRMSVGELDFARLQQSLCDLGYIGQAANWELPFWRQVRRDARALSGRRAKAYRPLQG